MLKLLRSIYGILMSTLNRFCNCKFKIVQLLFVVLLKNLSISTDTDVSGMFYSDLLFASILTNGFRPITDRVSLSRANSIPSAMWSLRLVMGKLKHAICPPLWWHWRCTAKLSTCRASTNFGVPSRTQMNPTHLSTFTFFVQVSDLSPSRLFNSLLQFENSFWLNT